MRTCAKCKLVKPTADFYRNRANRDGLQYECKTCMQARRTAWRARNPEKVKAMKRRWRMRYPEKNKAIHRRKAKKWAENNPQKVREASSRQTERLLPCYVRRVCVRKYPGLRASDIPDRFVQVKTKQLKLHRYEKNLLGRSIRRR
jgi:hypothetical protein